MAMDLHIDFYSKAMQYRRLHGGGRKQALARAIGIRGTSLPTIIDATAGLGKDAFQLACLGCQVTLIERHPEVHAQLAHALLAGSNPSDTTMQAILKRMALYHGEAIEWIAKLPMADVIYLDPMFPARNKSALVKQDMQHLQALVGHDHNNEALLSCALDHAGQRVVVKRHKSSPPLGEKAPSHQLIGKTNRFDIYQIHTT